MARLHLPRLARLTLLVAILAGVLAVATASAGSLQASAVYTSTNATGGNAVLVFARAADGTLSFADSYATGGVGTGSGLGSQGAVTLSDDGQWLLVVNAGSNDLSVFAVRPDGLLLTDREPSGGTMPISVTIHGGLVYVRNAGGDGNISGLTLDARGDLTSLPGSTRPLSGSATGPAQVQFTPDGGVLVVTEKAANAIVTYTVGAGGAPGAPQTFASSGSVPFGFDIARQGRLVVSEVGTRSASSYAVGDTGDVTPITAAAPTHQVAACWVVISKNGKFAYVANAGSASITGFALAPAGNLAILNDDGVTGATGSGSNPIDMAISHSDRFLYALSASNGSISVFSIHADGSLTAIDGVSGAMLQRTAGLAAR